MFFKRSQWLKEWLKIPFTGLSKYFQMRGFVASSAEWRMKIRRAEAYLHGTLREAIERVSLNAC